PQSNRMSMIAAFGSTSTGGAATAHPYIWKGDGTTASWPTTLATFAIAQDAGQNVSTVWEKAHSGTPQAFFSATASTSTTQQPSVATWTQAGGLTSWTAQTTTSGDVIVGDEMTASPNSDVINLMQNDKDGKLRARTYSGASWGSLITTNLTTALINETTTK